MTIRLRKATLGDAPRLAHLNMHVHQVHVDAQPDVYKPMMANDPELIAWFEDNLAKETTHIIIAEDDNEPVGYVQCFLRDVPENIFVYASQVLHIDQMSVNATHRGRGIGHLLMEEVVHIAKDLDVEVITLGVVGFNQGAIRFYEKHGFTVKSLRMWRHINEPEA